jgi:hypothetical protein
LKTGTRENEKDRNLFPALIQHKEKRKRGWVEGFPLEHPRGNPFDEKLQRRILGENA